jgi:hypothetical protein
VSHDSFMTASVSLQCAAEMHLHCPGCACTVCHHTCPNCSDSCRTVYVVPEHESILPQLAGAKVCAKCYLAVTTDVPNGQGCERCGAPQGYRSPRDRGGEYLCISCQDSSNATIDPNA